MTSRLSSRRDARAAARLLRRSLGLGSAVLVTAALAAGCGGDDGGDAATAATTAAQSALPTEVPDGTTLRVADAARNLQGPLAAAGAERDFSFTPEYSNFVSGPEMIEAVRAGEADLTYTGDAPVIFAQASGLDVRVVGVARNRGTSLHLVAAPGSGVERLTDLAGKKIAIAEGTGYQPFALAAVREAGLTPQDVEFVNLPPADVATALEKRQVDVGVLAEPWFGTYVARNGAAGGIELEEAKPLYSGLFYVLATPEALADPAKAAAIREYVQRWVRAVEWANEHPDEWIQSHYVEAQGLRPEVGRAIAEGVGGYDFPNIDDAVIARQQETADLLSDAGAIPEPLDVADSFDLRFDEVVQEAAGGDR